MPLEMEDTDGGELPRLSRARSGGQRFDGAQLDRPSRPWWRPAGTMGRVFLGLGVLTVLSGLTASGLFLKTWLSTDSRFRIASAGNIEAIGLTEVSRAQMLPVFGEDIGRNIFFVNLGDRRRQLEQIPWVERATVMRLLPDQIRVQVVERQPVAFVRQGQQIGLVDASGVLLTMPVAMMAQHHYSFPVVTGIEPRAPLASRKARMAVYERLLAELDTNGQNLSEQISEIDLTDPEDARVSMPEQGADILAHFGEDRFLERYQRYKSHIAEWRQQYPKLAAVDLRYDQQVVLEMAPGAAQAAAADQAAAVDQAAANADDPKPLAGDSAEETNAEPNPPLAVKAAAGKPVSPTTGLGRWGEKTESGKPPARAKVVKAAKKTGTKGASNAKNAAAKIGRKRAEAKRAALNASKRKPVPAIRPVAVAAQGQ
jgi:cell division protein FtsQ